MSCSPDFDSVLTNWDRHALGNCLMRMIVWLISRTKSVSMRASKARCIYGFYNCILAASFNMSESSGSHQERPADLWTLLETRCLCLEHVIKSSQRHPCKIREGQIFKCIWQLGIFARTSQWHLCADANHEADASHFKLMVDKKRFAMSNCTHTLQPIMCFGDRR